MREYNSKNRKLKSESLKEHVVEIALKELQKKNIKFSIKSLSKKCSSSERHIYRIFDNIEGLANEIHLAINKKMELEFFFESINSENIEEKIFELHSKFSKNSKLVSGYLNSELGKSIRFIWLNSKNRKLGKVLEELNFSLNKRKILGLFFSTKLWLLLKEEGNFKDEEIPFQIRIIYKSIFNLPNVF